MADRNTNASGRNSRASVVSAGSYNSSRGPGGSVADLAFSAPGVTSMLRTSTEMGNIGGLSMDPLMPNVPRASYRGGASSRMSTASSRSNTSNHTARHPPRASSASTATHRSRENNVPQYVPDTLSPTVMNISGSSPLIPHARESRREGHRSRSMTMANTYEPTFHLSSNRSLASLRSHEHMRYPTRLGKRPGYRSASPALSDPAGSYAHRVHGSQAGPLPPPPARLRTTSDLSLHPEERGYVVSGTSNRARTPSIYYGDPNPDIPPVPPLIPGRSIAVERTTKPQRPHKATSHRSAKASLSSASASQRTDSDAPSSDGPSPHTPKDGALRDALAHPVGTNMLMCNMSRASKSEVESGPLYYDYSEQFEPEQAPSSEPGTFPTGYVHHIKTIIEERGTPDPSSKKVDVSISEKGDGSIPTEVPDIAELPASPIPQRISRARILQVLEQPSTTHSVDISKQSPIVKGHGRATGAETVDSIPQEQIASSLHSDEVNNNRRSNLSQMGSSLMDSSTINFAVQNVIPLVADDGVIMDTDNVTEVVPQLDTEPTTGDGMSDLLDGYQHSDVKQDTEISLEQEDATDGSVEKRSSHAAKSSDEQSFKSCTDVQKLMQNSKEGKDVKSSGSFGYSPQLERPFKDSDVKSFRTCKDVATPDRAASFPASRVPLSSLAVSEPDIRTAFSEVSIASPLSRNQKQPPPSSSDSSMAKSGSRARSNSNVYSTKGSAAAGVSSIPGSGTQKHPSVPPRESSSSKEAQRSVSVASYLMNHLRRPKPFSGLSKKTTKDERSNVKEDQGNNQDIPTPPQMRERSLSNNLSKRQPPWTTTTPEKLLIKQDVVPQKQAETDTIRGSSVVPNRGSPAKMPVHVVSPVVRLSTANGSAPPNSPSLRITPLYRVDALGRSSPANMPTTLIAPVVFPNEPKSSSPSMPEVSSLHSPKNSSSPHSRVGSSPIILPRIPELGCRDNQTTTHLSWHGPKPSASTSVYTSNLHGAQENGQEETTTDLRFSGYRHPINHLPDVQEESHEDSSLNTSASNFRLPGSSQPNVYRVSVDDTAMFGRPPSIDSYAKNGLTKSGGLPSMNFSHSNLLEWMNDALNFRVSRSLEISQEDRKQELLLEAQRPVSAGEIRDIREKYRSFVASLDRWGKNEVATPPVIGDLVSRKRSFSSKFYMEELERLTVPSVGGLTQRLSELMPSLKEYLASGDAGEFPAEEVIMEHALEKINEVCGPANKRSSARLRPVPGFPDMVVIEDAVYNELTSGENEDSSSPNSGVDALPEKGLGEIGATRGRSWSEGHPHTRDKTTVAELTAQSPSATRTRSLSFGHSQLLTSSDSRLSSTSVRSRVNTETRPWNSDRNYPWATTIPSIDISLPLPPSVNHSPRPGPSHLRNRLSDASTTTGTFSPDGTPCSPPALVCATAVPGSSHHYAHGHRKSRQSCSIFGQSNRAHYPSAAGFDASGYPTRPVHVRGEDQSHGAGERYPTSALTLPPNLHLLGGSVSHISVDTSDDEQEVSSSRKRFGLKSRRNAKPSASRADSTRVQGSQPPRDTTEAVQEDSERLPERQHRQTFSGAQGLTKLGYYRIKIVDKVRSWYHKSADSARRLFRRSLRDHAQDSGSSDIKEETLQPGDHGQPRLTGGRS